MYEKIVDIQTSDGLMNSYIYRPEEGGPFPVIIHYTDSAGVREATADMCRRLASTGYYVIMPNLFYRKTRYLDIDVDRLSDPAYGDRLSLMWDLHYTVTNSRVIDDTRAILAYLRDDSVASPGPMGAVGYCMSGRFAFQTAGVFNDRITAAACMYGVRYVTEEEDSAHLVADKIQGEVYIGFAEFDPYVPPEAIELLSRVCADAGMKHRVEIYTGVEHGFVCPGRRVHNKASAERHWERLVSLFRRNLG
jgi:carboxymethylenebutenolidase